MRLVSVFENAMKHFCLALEVFKLVLLKFTLYIKCVLKSFLQRTMHQIIRISSNLTLQVEIPQTPRIRYLTVPPAFDQAGRGSPLAVHLPRTLIIFSYYKEKNNRTITISNFFGIPWT